MSEEESKKPAGRGHGRGGPKPKCECGECDLCKKREARRRQYHANKEHYAKYRSEYKAKNPGKYAKLARDRRKNNPEALEASRKACRDYYQEHKEERAEYNKKRREANPEQHKKWLDDWRKRNPNKQMDYRLKRFYKISLEEYRSMLDACGHACEACGADVYEGSESWHSQACIDHCHETGLVRGILCSPCNSSLGYAYDDPATIIGILDYIIERDKRK